MPEIEVANPRSDIWQVRLDGETVWEVRSDYLRNGAVECRKLADLLDRVLAIADANRATRGERSTIPPRPPIKTETTRRMPR